MTLPDFIGIGAMRSGTTWLYQQLLAHPQVFVPPLRKEVHYFDRHYDRGLDWYASFFPPGDEAARYRAIGEITPIYMYRPEIAQRIRDDVGTPRLVALLRDPVRRAFSQYTMEVARFETKETFAEFIARRPDAVERGRYARLLEPYLERFPAERILVLVSEHAFADPAAELGRLAAFLGVDPGGFDPTRAERPVNRSFRRRLPAIYTGAQKTRRWLHRRGARQVLRPVRRLGLNRVFRTFFVALGSRAPMPTMSAEDRRLLAETYAPDLERLERTFGLDLSVWREG